MIEIAIGVFVEIIDGPHFRYYREYIGHRGEIIGSRPSTTFPNRIVWEVSGLVDPVSGFYIGAYRENLKPIDPPATLETLEATTGYSPSEPVPAEKPEVVDA